MKTKSILLLAVSLIFAVNAAAQIGEVTFSRTGKTPDSVSEFKSGEYFFAHVKFKQPIGAILTLGDRPVTFTTEFFTAGKMLDEEMYGFDVDRVKNSRQDVFVVPIISDPSADHAVFGKNLFAIRLPGAFAKLPAGEHEIEFKLRSYNYRDGAEVMASGKFKLIKGSDARSWYQKNEKDSYEAFGKRGVTTVIASERDVALGVVGGKSVVTLVNNCGRSVWLRKAGSSDTREYRLSPGQEMRYDRDGGYLEEWNFGTKKWNTVTKVFEPNAAGKANICK